MKNNQQSFWQFSDQLRLQTANLANLSLNNDSIWSKRPDERINFDVGGYTNSSNNNFPAGSPLNGLGYGWRPEKSNLGNDFDDGFGYCWKMNVVNGFDDGWKLNKGPIGSPSPQQNFSFNGGFNKGLYSKSPTYFAQNNNVNFNVKGQNKNKTDDLYGAKGGRKNSNPKKNNIGETNSLSDDAKAGVDKRFKIERVGICHQAGSDSLLMA